MNDEDRTGVEDDHQTDVSRSDDQPDSDIESKDALEDLDVTTEDGADVKGGIPTQVDG